MKSTKMMLILILTCFSIFLSGCALKLKTKEVQSSDYQSIGNEMKLFGFGVGENIHNIENQIKGPIEKDNPLYEFPKEKLNVYTEYQISKFISTENTKFRIRKKVAIGMPKEEVVKKLKLYDLYEYQNKENGLSYVFFKTGSQKVIFELKNNLVDKIFIGNSDVPYEQMITNKQIDKNDVQKSDDKFVSDSNTLTFKINYKNNNKKILSKHFLDYVNVGMIQDVPAPIGMDKNDFIYKFGQPNYIFDGVGKVDSYYFYRRFDVYMGFDKDNKLIELILPVSIHTEDLKDSRFPKKPSLNANYGDYHLQLKEKIGNIQEAVITNKKG